MPTPSSEETRSQFIRRCVPYVIHEGTARGPRQAVAICHSLWARHHVTHNARGRNPLRVDPTRTAMLRRRFVGEMNRRFLRLRKAIIDLIDREDAFGLKQTNFKELMPTDNVVTNQRWRALRSDEQIEAFKGWLQLQIDQGILEKVQTDAARDVWLKQYIEESYAKGQGRAFDDAMKKYKYGNQAAPQYYQGTRDQFLRSNFGRPASIERVKMIASRSFQDLKNVTEAMSTQMQRTLTDSFIQGDHPYVMARKLTKDVDKIGKTRAKTIARTETIRAHAEGQLDALQEMGVEKVGVMVEWSTAGDSLVCPLCADMEATVLKIGEARGMIPRHPNCRCAWIPANVGEPTKGQKRTAPQIRGSIGSSVMKEVSKAKTVAEAKRRSKWAGADAKIAPKRPKHAAAGELDDIPTNPVKAWQEAVTEDVSRLTLETSKTLPDLYAEMRIKYPELTEDEFKRGLLDLYKRGKIRLDEYTRAPADIAGKLSIPNPSKHGDPYYFVRQPADWQKGNP